MKSAPLFLSLFVGLASLGCTLPPPKDFIGYVNLHSALNPHGDQIQVLESGLVSPTVQLSREPGGFRGWANGQQIEMRIEGDTVKGTRGSQPIELHVTREGPALVSRGLYGGRLTELSFCVPPKGAPAGDMKVTGIQGDRQCLVDNAPTVAKMVATLGDTSAMAMLVAIYFR